MTGPVSSAEVRGSVFATVRAAGPEYWMLIAFATIATNLIDFATLPAPGERPGGVMIAVAIVRILAVFFVTFALERRMAGLPAPMRQGTAFPRFFLFSLVMAILFGGLVRIGAMFADAREMSLAAQWLTLFLTAAIWGVATIRLIGWGPALATGAPFGALPAVLRATRGAAVPLALAFVQIVLPFAAIHQALTLLGVRLPLPGNAFAALALIDGIVSAVQLAFASALAVTAWRLSAGPPQPLRAAPPRG